MKIMDDKGRFFGKINIIDILVILFIILIIAVGVKFVYFKESTIELTTVDILKKNQDQWRLDAISKGDIQIKDEEVIAKIIKLETKPSQMIITTDDGEIIIKDHPIKKDIFLTIELISEFDRDQRRFNNQVLLIGNGLRFQTEKYNIKGTIVDMR